MPARPLAWLVKALAMFGGGLGCYLLVRKFSNRDTFIPFLAAVAYMTTCRSFGNLSLFQYGRDWLLIALPIFFVHIILERRSIVGLIGLAMFGTMLNLNTLWILPAAPSEVAPTRPRADACSRSAEATPLGSRDGDT